MLLLCNVANGFAKDYEWIGADNTNDSIRKSKSSFPSSITSDADHIFFLYNVGAKKFVYAGGKWGAQAILSDKATRFQTSSNGLNITGGLDYTTKPTYFCLTSAVAGPEGHYLGVKDDAIYLNCSKNSGSIFTSDYDINQNIAFNFVPVNNSKYKGKQVYLIRALYGAGKISEQQGSEVNYLYVDTSQKDYDGIYDGKIVLKNYYDKVDGYDENNPCAYNDNFKEKYHQDSRCSIMSDEYAMWQLVTLTEIKDKLSKLNPQQMDEPFDCTFFLRDADFSRYVANNGAWDVWPKDRPKGVSAVNIAKDQNGNKIEKGSQGWKMGLDHLYSSELSNDENESRYGTGIFTFSNSSNAKKVYYGEPYGKYFCAQVKGLCDDYKTEVNLDQNWTCQMSGWYRVTCQGYVKDGGSYLYAKTTGGNQARYQSEPLRDYTQWDQPKIANCGRQANPDVEYGTEKGGQYEGNMLRAGKMFYAGAEQYLNTLYIYVEKDQDLEIGVRFRGDNNTLTIIDDFRMAYIGNEDVALVLDEDKTNLEHIHSALTKQNNFNGTMVALRRPLKQEVWNTVVLPVSLTRSQCDDLFGKGSKVAEMSAYSDGVIKFLRTENEKTADNDIILHANTPCIVKPYTRSSKYSYSEGTESSLGNTFNYTWDDDKLHSVSITDSCTTTRLGTDQGVDATYITSDEDWYNTDMTTLMTVKNGLAFHGTLVKTYDESKEKSDSERYHVDLKGKYITSGGEIKYVPTTRVGYGLKGLRGWFGFGEAPTTGNNAKAIKFSIDGVEENADNVTGLDELFEDGFAYTTGNDSKVYNLSGQLVSSNGSTQGLEKGIYIIKGKKVVVK